MDATRNERRELEKHALQLMTDAELCMIPPYSILDRRWKSEVIELRARNRMIETILNFDFGENEN